MKNFLYLIFQIIVISACAFIFLSPLNCLADGHDADNTADVDFTTFSLEQLKDVEIISVSKKPEKVSKVPAAVFVITQEDIRRSGVTNIAEALRLAPGVQVARENLTEWAITVRSPNDSFSNNLLVMIDGRSVYSPVFSGVHWDLQDTVLEDIDRIEVIRGPGATVWGANAVNGVINIITKRAEQTQGTQMTVLAGTQERIGSVRYGGTANENTWYRIYAKYLERDSTDEHFPNESWEDNWNSARGGFRIDRGTDTGTYLTLQGEAYLNRYDTQVYRIRPDPPYATLLNDVAEDQGYYILGRWHHVISDTSDIDFQFYYDDVGKTYWLITDSCIDTLDLDFRHRFAPFPKHEIIWGMGYRFIKDKFFIHNEDDRFEIDMIPSSLEQDIFSAFIQDEIQLIPDKLSLTIGSKFEHNDYTGFEIQPGIRCLWTPHHRHALWASVSRAVRTPSRYERDGKLIEGMSGQERSSAPTIFMTYGNDDLDSEKLIAYEIGYRIEPFDNLRLDITTFYHNYDNLIGIKIDKLQLAEVPSKHNIIPLKYANGLDGDAYGTEITAEWQVLNYWRLKASYSSLETDLPLETFIIYENSDEHKMETDEDETYPGKVFSLHSLLDITDQIELDLWLRYVDRVEKRKDQRNNDTDEIIESYTTLDARLTWKPRNNLEISLVGQNLLEKQHQEFSLYEVERSVYLKAVWEF